MAFCPTKPVSLEGAKAICCITNGPKFNFTLIGKAVKPLFNFSFFNYDFGLHFLHHKGIVAPEVVLRVENKNSFDISFESSWENKAHLQA